MRLKKLVSDLLAVSLLLSVSTTVRADADAFPSKPITLVGPFSAGSSTDVIARIYANKLSAILGKPVLVENRPGAAGMISVGYVSRAPADGHTLLVASNSYITVPYVYKEPKYSLKDFVGVTGMFTTSLTMLVGPNFPAKTLPEFVALVKRSPGKYTYGTWGVGSSAHLQMELLKMKTGLHMVHIPYKSGPEVSLATIAGDIDVAFDTVFGVAQRVKSGQLHALTVFAPKRANVMPDVPVNAEGGYPDIDLVGFAGIVASAKLPKDILSKLSQASQKVVNDPEYQSRLRSYGAEPITMNVDEWNKFLQDEAMKVNEVTRKAKISLD